MESNPETLGLESNTLTPTSCLFYLLMSTMFTLVSTMFTNSDSCCAFALNWLHCGTSPFWSFDAVIQLVESVDEGWEGARTAPLSEDDETRRPGFLTAPLSVQLQRSSAAAVSTCVHFNTKQTPHTVNCQFVESPWPVTNSNTTELCTVTSLTRRHKGLYLKGNHQAQIGEYCYREIDR